MDLSVGTPGVSWRLSCTESRGHLCAYANITAASKGLAGLAQGILRFSMLFPHLVEHLLPNCSSKLVAVVAAHHLKEGKYSLTVIRYLDKQLV